MKIQRRGKTIGLTVVLAVFAAVLAFAQNEPPAGPPDGAKPGIGHDGHHRGKFGRFMRGGHGDDFHRGGMAANLLLRPRIKAHLGLSDDQVKQIEQSKVETQKLLIQKEADIKTAQLEFHELLKQTRPDRNQVMALADRLAQLRGERFKIGVNQRLDLRQILTEEQVNKVKEIIEKRKDQARERFKGGRKGRFGHHPGQPGEPPAAGAGNPGVQPPSDENQTVDAPDFDDAGDVEI